MSGGRYQFVLHLRRLACWALALGWCGLSPALAQLPGPGLPPGAAAAPRPLMPPASPRALPGAPAGDAARAASAIPSAPQVAEVRVVGNKTVSTQKIMPSIKTRAGRPLDKSRVEEDVRALIKTHLFINVEPVYERTPEGGVIVTFKLVERPTVQYVKYYGTDKSERTLQKQTGIKKGDALDPYAVDEGRSKLETWYHSKAYSQATVTTIEGDKVGDRGVRYVINEGLKQKVGTVTFDGNTILSDSRLKTQIKSKPPILWVFKGEVDYDRIAEDVHTLTENYRALGYFRARISREVVFNDKQTKADIRFVIDEGPRYVVGNVSVIGNTKIETEELMKDLTLTSDNFFDQAKMNKDIAAMQSKFGQVGYIFADVQSQPRFRGEEEPGKMDLVYKVEEGSRYRVGRITVKIGGDNPHTRHTAVLNRLSVRTGDIANTKKVLDSERRLKASSMFSNQSGGNPPKIVFSRPGLEDSEQEESIAGKPKDKGKGGGGGKVRGQSPDDDAKADPGELRPGESIELDLVPLPPLPDVRTGATTVARPQLPGDHPSVIFRGQNPTAPYQPPYQPTYNAQPSVPNGVGQQPLRRMGPDAGGPNPNAVTISPGIVTPSVYAQPVAGQQGRVMPVQYNQNVPGNGYAPATPPNNYTPPGGYSSAPPAAYAPGAAQAPPPAYTPAPTYGAAPASQAPGGPAYGAPPAPNVNRGGNLPPPFGSGYAGPDELIPPDPAAGVYDPTVEPPQDIDLDVIGTETQTGRLMLGVGVNSNSGLVGNIVLDEQNFDFWRWPTSWEEIRNATAWRGGGQQFRIEAAPGTVFSRYLINFHNPYLFNTPISGGISGSYFTRLYQNWTEQRLGGRVAIGYQFLFDPNLTTTLAFRGENVNISNPTVPTPPELTEVLGNNTFLSGKWEMIHDTRDSAFLPTQGHRVSVGLEEAFGSFVFPRATLDASQHFLLHQRPDSSGRHTLSLNTQLGFTGSNTPIYENFFAGGFTTLRGFYFRGASPLDMGVQVGGHFSWINSVEYMFPLTADDMLRAVVFCDFGTVEQNITIQSQNFRISPGAGLRVNIPAMGPAPIALDFGIPVAHAPGDRLQIFSFNVGLAR